MFALLNGLKPAIKGQVLAKKSTILRRSGRWRATCGIVSIR